MSAPARSARSAGPPAGPQVDGSPADGPPADAPAGAARHARRLLRWYPGPWRARYGAEFTELLIADLAERPRSRARTLDVIRGGLVARLSGAGLTGHPLDPLSAAGASLATLACCLAAFLVLGGAMWAQLTVGWQWAPPSTPATGVAMVVMSAATACFAVLAALAAAPVAWRAVAAAARRQARGLGRPSLAAAAGALALLAGGRHFGNGWPGTGGHWWPHQGLVPGGVAAFGWACTQSVTSYWAHPGALASFPPAELAWMAASPVAVILLVSGVALLVRRLGLPARVLRFEAWLGSAAALAMAAFLAGAWCWVAEGGPGPRGLFHTGTIDVASLAVMATALATGGQAAYRAHRAAAGPGGTAGSLQ